MAVSAKDHRVWVPWLVGLRACPKCGYAGTRNDPVADEFSRDAD
jgi:hypothetical protein